MFTRVAGMPVIVTDLATAELPSSQWDWSGCRSPSRARRRRDLRHVITREPACYQVRGALHVHPRLWREIQRQLSADDAAMLRRPWS